MHPDYPQVVADAEQVMRLLRHALRQGKTEDEQLELALTLMYENGVQLSVLTIREVFKILRK